MVTRTAQLAAQFAAVNDEISALIMGCTEEQWRQPCVDEAREVGVVAHHAATVQQEFTRIVATLATGETYTPGASMGEVDQFNAQQAQENAAVGKVETLDILHRSAATIAQHLRGFDDTQLERIAGTFGDHDLTVGQVIEMVVIGHAGVHRDSIRATIAG